MMLALLAPAMLAGCAETAQDAARAAIDAAGCADMSAAQSESSVFQYGGAASCKTAKETHAWANPGPYAMVQWGGAVVEGSIDVRILDAAGREVHAFTLTAASAEGEQTRTQAGFPSAPGVATWTVELAFQDFTGTMGLQVMASAPPQ